MHTHTQALNTKVGFVNAFWTILLKYKNYYYYNINHDNNIINYSLSSYAQRCILRHLSILLEKWTMPPPPRLSLLLPLCDLYNITGWGIIILAATFL